MIKSAVYWKWCAVGPDDSCFSKTTHPAEWSVLFHESNPELPARGDCENGVDYVQHYVVDHTKRQDRIWRDVWTQWWNHVKMASFENVFFFSSVRSAGNEHMKNEARFWYCMKLLDIYIYLSYVWEEPAVSCRWTGWVWWITRWSWRIQEITRMLEDL